MKWLKDYKNWVIILLFIFLIYIIIKGIYPIFNKRNFKVVPESKINYYVKEWDYNLTQKEAISLVKEHVNYPANIFIRKEGKHRLNGKVFILLQQVYMDDNLKDYEIIYVLTHELCHLKYNTYNETYVEFMTFKELYESDNPILKLRAEWMVYEHCTLEVKEGSKYDINYHIQKYLNNLGLLKN